MRAGWAYRSSMEYWLIHCCCHLSVGFWCVCRLYLLWAVGFYFHLFFFVFRSFLRSFIRSLQIRNLFGVFIGTKRDTHRSAIGTQIKIRYKWQCGKSHTKTYIHDANCIIEINCVQVHKEENKQANVRYARYIIIILSVFMSDARTSHSLIRSSSGLSTELSLYLTLLVLFSRTERKQNKTNKFFFDYIGIGEHILCFEPFQICSIARC